MTLAVRIDEIGRNDWASLGRLFADYNFCQCWDYGALLAEKHGAESSHAVVYEDEEAVLLAECRTKKVPGTGIGIAYSSGGPLWRKADVSKNGIPTEALGLLREAYVAKRRLVLRVDPRLMGEEGERILGETGFVPSGEESGYRTMVLDLSPDLTELRRGLHQKWRNCLSRSERNGLEIRAGNDLSLLDVFCGLYLDLTTRKRFEVPLGAAFYRRLQALLPEEEKLHVAIAYDGDCPVAGHVASMLGDSCIYVLGASSTKGRETKAAYLLQWHVITEAKRRNLRWYDLGGIDPEGNPGVYRFKSGLGGREVMSRGPFEAVSSSAKRMMLRGAEGCYGYLRKVRNRVSQWLGTGRSNL